MPQPFDMATWAESTQNNGFAGVAGKGPAPLAFTGDIITAPKGKGGRPIINALGSWSATKPKGCRLKGNRSRNQEYLYGPADIHGPPLGWITDLGYPLKEGEEVTAEADNTNVAENTVVYAALSYGQPLTWPQNLKEAARMAGAADVIDVLCQVTPAAAVTPFSGEVTLDSASQADLWIDPDAEYTILGLLALPSLALNGGVAHFRGLPKEWNGFVPGLPLGALSAVDFLTGGLALAPAGGIGPFPGDAMPTVGFCTGHTSAAQVVLKVGANRVIGN